MTGRPIRGRRWRRLRDDSGQATVFVLALLPLLLVFGGLVFDGGAYLTAHTRAVDLAQSAARTGAQQLDLTALRAHDTTRAPIDPAAARAAALRVIRSNGLSGTATATPTRVRVQVTGTGHTRLLGVIGIDTFTVRAAGAATAQQQP
ncbi:pilus assembly protein TadG-related protein [Actinocatenispora rupis]|uniref:Putative Flp pilus-assembly TadG-like N-terminal domain-containing protein n=1 Tax=Actinocatenispora rupis TaxID=519421 RepID=A0A8J3JFA0_9ACTN|nr:pilus assembly protein TadG-related protein [Actinocatenispora rupis]GID14878.1 hypothetical protein Aru02nite_57670 [Actinocatenispora rupis]